VHLTLLAATRNSVTAAYGAISDRDGHFSIATIRPGAYMVRMERTGFLFGAVKISGVPVSIVTIRAGQQLTGFTVELAPPAILSGRVLDDLGDPVQDVSVVRIDVDEDPARFSMHPASMPTDDRGEFRIVAPPGRYYLQTSNSGSRINKEASEQRDGVAIAPLRSTYYPSSILKGRATPVEAVAGKETSGLEIRMLRQAAASISGIVRGVPDPALRPSVVIRWSTTPGGYTFSRSIPTNAEGRFVIQDAQTGDYQLYASWSGKPPMVSAVTNLRIADAGVDNVDNIELTLGPAGEVAGVVQVEGDAPGVDAPKRIVRLESIIGYSPMQPSGGDTDSRGAFTLSGIAPSRYRVLVTPLPDNGYVKKLVVDDTDTPDGMLDMSTAARSARIKVLVARDGAQIAGRVLDEKGEGNPGGFVLLSPVPVPKEITRENTARSGTDGAYSFKSLPPGKYRILAIDPFRNAGSSFSEMAKMLEKGEEIEFQPRAKLQRDLHPLPTPNRQ
jgi:hypothetical protein